MLMLRGGDVLLEEGGLVRADVLIVGDRIAEIDRTGTLAADEADVWDVSGRLVLPGIIDLHGDAFERQVMPRPGVTFDLGLALMDTDRQMIANGITTAYHGLTWSWEPGLRGREAAYDFLDGLDRVGGHLACDTRLHLRHETYNLEAEETILGWLADGRVSLLAFNDHLPMIQEKAAKPGGLEKYADRAGMTAEYFRALVDTVAARRDAVPPSVERLAEAALRHGVVMASHDDETPAMRQWYHDRGCTICEFPVNRATAEHGHALGNPVIMGGPNILRGGSHAGRLSAEEMLTERLCDVLTSDYYYPSLLQAVFNLVRRGVQSLDAAWPLVSTHPARAAGLHDRGTLAPGRRADVLVVEAETTVPHVLAAIVAGHPRHVTDIRALTKPQAFKGTVSLPA